VLLTRPPLAARGQPVRLACIRRAASVRPEPGSNSPDETATTRRVANKFVETIGPCRSKAAPVRWKRIGLLCELDWLVSLCVSLLAHHSAVVNVLVSGAPITRRTLLYQTGPAVSRTMKKLGGPARAHKNRRLQRRTEALSRDNYLAEWWLVPCPPLICFPENDLFGGAERDRICVRRISQRLCYYIRSSERCQGFLRPIFRSIFPRLPPGQRGESTGSDSVAAQAGTAYNVARRKRFCALGRPRKRVRRR
jgi:hypothetical protein